MKVFSLAFYWKLNSVLSKTKFFIVACIESQKTTIYLLFIETYYPDFVKIDLDLI